MPTYTVTDPQTGRKVKLTGDSPPTEAELTQVFARLAPATEPSGLATIGEMAGDVLGGLRSSAARTVYGGGDLIRRATGMERVVNRPDVQAEMTAPESRAGSAASFVGDVGQFFLPTGVIGKGAKLAEIAKSGALTLAQTRDPLSAGVSAGLTAVIPGGGAVKRASGALSESAEKSMAQALGATKDRMKDEAANLSRPMLERGVGGSRAAMLERAKAMTASGGAQLEAAYAAAAAAGDTVSGQAIRSTVRHAADAFKVPNAAGTNVVIPGTEHIVQKLQNLDEFIGTLGDDIPVDRAVHLKRTWDDIVSTAGLFGSKATASATDNAEARAIKAASDSFRTLLNTNPTVGALNAEVSFWTGLKTVLKATQKRTQAQGGGLIAAGMGGSGAVAGALSGNSTSDRVQNAVLGGFAGRQLVKTIQSPAFRTRVSGPLKDKLADALASGRTGNVIAALGKITAAMPAQISSAVGATR